MFARSVLIFASLSTISFAAVRSGKAEADWLSASGGTYIAGRPEQMALRLVVDAGWHTYWLNPGEGGMKISVAWELPAGWTAGELEHPAPKCFMTGELAGFGYEGVVIFPVKFTPPTNFTGEAKLKGKISWLTCNADQCLPGSAELEISLVPGWPTATAEARLIEEAMLKIPQPQKGWVHLGVTEKADVLALKIEAHSSRPLNLDDCEIFPATPQVIDSAAKIQFTRNGTEWNAEVPKSEYSAKPIRELTLILASKTGQAPMALTWKSE